MEEPSLQDPAVNWHQIFIMEFRNLQSYTFVGSWIQRVWFLAIPRSFHLAKCLNPPLANIFQWLLPVIRNLIFNYAEEFSTGLLGPARVFLIQVSNGLSLDLTELLIFCLVSIRKYFKLKNLTGYLFFRWLLLAFWASALLLLIHWN